MTRHTLLLVGGTDDTVRTAAELGLRVLLLQHPDKVNDTQRALAAEVRVLDYTEWSAVEPVARELAAAPGFEVALSLTEPGLDAAARINDLFGLGGTGHAVTRRFRDKLAMRAHLAAADPLDPLTVPAEPVRTRADLDSFAARHGYPYVVKPTDATASIGVRKVTGPAEADAAFAAVTRLRGTRTDRVSALFVLREFLVESYVEGPEYSVEAFSFGGRHVVVAVTEKFVAPHAFAEVGHAVPARLPDAQRARIAVAVDRFLDRMGLLDGVTHTEVRLGPDGPVVIESHNRIAGDAIPELVTAAYGVDLVRYALGWPFGLVDELPAAPPPTAAASTRFVVAGPGRVASVDGVAAALARPDVLAVRVTARPGEPVHGLRDNWDRLALVAVRGPDTDAAIAAGAALVRDTLDIRVTGPDGVARRAEVAELGRGVAA